MNIKIVVAIVIFCVLWILAVLLFYDKKKIIVDVVTNANPKNNAFDKDEDINVPLNVEFNIIFDDESQLNYELLSDLTLHYKDLLEGNYKIPPSMRAGKEKNEFKDLYDEQLEQKIKLIDDTKNNYVLTEEILNKINKS